MSYDSLQTTATLVDLEQPTEARQVFADWVTDTPQEEVTALISAVTDWHQGDKVGTARLRYRWKRGSPDTRAMVEVLASLPKPRLPWLEDHQDKKRDTKQVFPVTTKQAPSLIPDEDQDQGESQEQTQEPEPEPEIAEEPAKVRDYFKHRAGVDDDPGPREEMPWGPPPPDDPHALRGSACVTCFVERSVNAQHWQTSAHDDGQCDECREDGKTGIPNPPDTTARVAHNQARYNYLASQYPTEVVRTLMRRDWNGNYPDREIIGMWASRNLPTEPPEREEPAPSHKNTYRYRKPVPVSPARHVQVAAIMSECADLSAYYAPEQAHLMLDDLAAQSSKADAAIVEQWRNHGSPKLTGRSPRYAATPASTQQATNLTARYPHLLRTLIRGSWQQAENNPYSRAVFASWGGTLRHARPNRADTARIQTTTADQQKENQDFGGGWTDHVGTTPRKDTQMRKYAAVSKVRSAERTR